MSAARQPAGIPQGGRFARQTRARAQLSLVEPPTDAGNEGDPVLDSCRMIYARRAAAFTEVSNRTYATLAEQLAAMSARRVAYDRLDAVAILTDQPVGFEPPVDPERLVEAGRWRDALLGAAAGLHDDPDGAGKMMRSLLPNLPESEADTRLERIARAGSAATLFFEDSDAAYALTAAGGDPDGLLGVIDFDDYAGVDEDGCSGYDFEAITDALVQEWSRREHAEINALAQAHYEAAGVSARRA